jgi:hypothetical protein
MVSVCVWTHYTSAAWKVQSEESAKNDKNQPCRKKKKIVYWRKGLGGFDMYKNIGKKIKIVSVVFCVLGILICVCFGLSIIIPESENLWYARHYNYGSSYVKAAQSEIWRGVCYCVGGAVVSWVTSLIPYGFGELIEKISDIAGKMNGIDK